LLWLGQHLLSYNEPSRTVPVLAWVAGCFIKPFLKRVEAKYPHLFLIGEAPAQGAELRGLGSAA